ncbi:MAG: DUF86 domain-containing protein [Caldilineaceae bacterium]|nr:DUF86 domain-containing protein [Caldilineaceae bacterium]MBP8105985.1 DUF86 domain-containing protein [Caldilineaceae bacterium]MBP8123671.1 DUF86 domain-containing protein [Caldilineaceae bacterium]MBP9071905.1 DUF86 domain-containing protein [Caldilineaceae bacterium]
MSPSPNEYLHHILDETEYLMAARQGLIEGRFLKDATRKRAFVRSLEIIGEATKNLSAEFREAHPDVDWRSMAGMRDRLIHGYMGVDYELVWDVVVNHIPDLHDEIQHILSELE